MITGLRVEEGDVRQSGDAWNGEIKQGKLPGQEMKLSWGQRESLILVTERGEEGLDEEPFQRTKKKE